MENLAFAPRGKRKIPFFSKLFELHSNVAVKYRTKKNLYRTIKQISHNKTTNNKIVKQNLFALVFISIKRIKIAQAGVNILFCFFGLYSNLAVKKSQQKAIVFVFLLISGQNLHQVATALRMHLVRLLKRTPRNISKFEC